MHCAILTLFPEAIRPYLDESILGIAQAQGNLRVDLVDFRNCTLDPHRTVDDRPFGGGPGMVLKPEPIFTALEDVELAHGPFHKILLCPRGRTFDQARARELSREPRLLFLCGRYEGYDERIRQGFAWEEISLGDFVLAGGELAALAILEAAVRLIPGVLGCAESAVTESFEGEWLDHPQYTRPRQFRDLQVPDVLLSGDHQKVAAWRHEQARLLTRSKLLTQERSPRDHPLGHPLGNGLPPQPAGQGPILHRSDLNTETPRTILPPPIVPPSVRPSAAPDPQS